MPRTSRATWRRALAVREFRGVFAAEAASLLGDQLARIAVAILVFEWSRSPLLAALTYAVSYAPALVAGPLLGHLADTRPRRELMVACDLIRAGLVAVMLLPHLHVWMYIAVLFVVGWLDPPFDAARSALLYDVLDGDLYAVGQSISGVTYQVAQVVGFGLGGLTVAILTPRGALGIDVASFLLSAVLVRSTVRRRSAPRQAGDLGHWEAISSGTRVVLADPTLRRLIGMTAASFGTIIATEGLAVAYAHQIGQGDVATGLLTAAVPVGSALGVALVGRVPAARRIAVMRPLAVLWPLPLLVTLARPGVAVTFALWASAGALASFQLLANVMFAQLLGSEIRGRAFAFAQSLLMAVQGLGLLLAGSVADLAAPSTAVAAAGLVGLIMCVAFALRISPDAGRSDSAPAGSLQVSAGSSDQVPESPLLHEPVEVAVAARGRRRALRRRLVIYAIATSVLAVGALVVVQGPWSAISPRPFYLPWWVLGLLFAVTELLDITFQRGREAHIISITQIPRIAALFLAGPAGLLAGALLGVGGVDASRRIGLMKQIVNLAAVAAETAACLATFNILVTSDDGISTKNLLAALVATLVYDLTGSMFISVIRKVFDPTVPVRAFVTPMAFSLLTSMTVGLLGLVAVAAIYANTVSSGFLLIVGILTAAGFRAYINLQARHVDLGRLYAFQESLGALVPRGPSLFPVLEHARGLLLAESVSLYLTPATGGITDHHELRVHVDEAPTERTYTVSPETEAFQSADEIIAELRVGDRLLGTLVARERLGSVQSFTRNELRLLRTLGAQVSDALERGTLLEQLQLAATHDALTGLLTLAEFLRRLDERVVQDGRYRLCLLDVVGLHEVNDSLGHDAGDALLRTLGRRLEDLSGESALLARSGGGEFAVALPDDSTRAGRQIEKLVRGSNGLVQVLGVTVELRTRAGWLTLPRDATDSATALRRADLALATSKSSGSQITRFTTAMDVDGMRRLRLVNDLRQAIVTNQLRLVYQPLVTPHDKTIIGAEALVRWDHPDLGSLSPDEFIPIAEHTGLITDLTRFVLDRALAQLRNWHDQERPLRVAVNVSARCLSDMTLPGVVTDSLSRHKMSPEYLTLEVTETSVAEDPVRALAVLQRLRDIGVRLSIDDFGTGYSSLAALKRFPVQEVKLDRQFLVESSMPRDGGKGRTLLSAVVTLGHSLDLEIVAEGVENVEMFRYLRELGVDVLQGFYLGRPCGSEEFPQVVAAVKRV